ncbi:hypothetical protein ATHL_02000 [Anaerolinea thermolimosa]|uniref:hypothetical protein n=1 Tax=Anaerolinea thermolimosa TaxID=229919 RepID=UPI0007831E47|nr:hypothetical protein [Anaerolinea thermolimosa]GAP07132.1 hypothetical protein ATHL_02000 [Anaerolinea thermolimosa]
MEDHDLLITLNQKVDHILKIVEDTDRRLRSVEIDKSAIQNEVDTLSDEVERLRVKSDTWSTINSIGIALGTLLGILK